MLSVSNPSGTRILHIKVTSPDPEEAALIANEYYEVASQYVAAMIALGDFIGGVDLDVEMSYDGNSGKHYSKGMQHLDGQGMMDYVRARRNATVNAHDIGRTGRQRQVMAAIFRKVKSNAGLIKRGWKIMPTAARSTSSRI